MLPVGNYSVFNIRIEFYLFMMIRNEDNVYLHIKNLLSLYYIYDINFASFCAFKKMYLDKLVMGS